MSKRTSASLEQYQAMVESAENANVADLSLLELWNDFLERIDGEDPREGDANMAALLDNPVGLLERMKAEAIAAGSRAFAAGCARDEELSDAAKIVFDLLDMMVPEDQRRFPFFDRPPRCEEHGEMVEELRPGEFVYEPTPRLLPPGGEMHMRIAIYLGVAFGLMQAGAVLSRHTKGARMRMTDKGLNRIKRRNALRRYIAKHGPVPPAKEFGRTNPERTRYFLAFKRRWGSDFSRDTFNRDAAEVARFPDDPLEVMLSSISARIRQS